LIDGTEEDVGSEYRKIVGELKAYPGGLAEKPRVTVINKLDVEQVHEEIEAKTAAVAAEAGEPPMTMSGASGEGVGPLLDRLLALVPEVDDEAPVVETPSVTPAGVTGRAKERVWVTRDEEVYIVSCRQAERFAPLVRLDNWRARMQFHAELERLGVITALEKAGVEAGDTVRIANRELEWE
jgi:GTP-binding protein